MKKRKKKQQKQNKGTSVDAADLQAVIDRLREENEILRGKLERIAALASDFPASDDEDDEYDELTRDVDDEIADAKPQADSSNAAV